MNKYFQKKGEGHFLLFKVFIFMLRYVTTSISISISKIMWWWWEVGDPGEYNVSS